MSDAYAFLTSLGQALSTLALYPAGHPSRERAVDASFELLERVGATGAPRVFTFLHGDVIFAGQMVPRLSGWAWGERLSGAGIERLEFLPGATREEYAAWLDQVFAELSERPLSTAEARQEGERRILYGPVDVAAPAPAASLDATVARALPALAQAALDLRDEADTVRWIHQELEDAGHLPVLEAATVVRSLSATMHSERTTLLPLLQLKEFDQYTATHAINVAVLSMGLAEVLGFAPKDVRMLGLAGLLHDLGKIRIPRELLVKPGRFTDAERAVVQQHPVEGAKLIVEREHRLDIPAFVAYEHHIMLDGGGYPALRHERGCHYASRLVHVCDVYDALRTHRPYRAAWAAEKTIAYLEERSGTEFDPALVQPFVRMLREAGERPVEIDG